MNCSVCAHADEHGWWGQSGTHCRGCHRSWTGLSEAHCKACHQSFTSDSVAELHEPYCSNVPAEVAESMAIASRKDGNPLFDTRQRKSGLVWVRWRPTDHHFAATNPSERESA